VGIANTNINHSIKSISKDSEKKKDFITLLIKEVSNLNSSDIRTKEDLENLVQQLACMFKNAWNCQELTPGEVLWDLASMVN